MNVAQETLGFRRGSLSLPLSLLMSAFALPIPPAAVTSRLRRLTERSPTACAIPLIRSTFGARRDAATRQTVLSGENAIAAPLPDDNSPLSWALRLRPRALRAPSPALAG